MPRLSPAVAFVLMLVIGLQMAACLASGDCSSFAAGNKLTSSAALSDCDGCGCCGPSPGWPPPHRFPVHSRALGISCVRRA